MRDRGWRVVRIDLMADCAADIVADVRALPLKPFPVDLLWASPDCTQFTLERLPFASCKRKAGPIDLAVPLAIKELIAAWRPRFWIVENVEGSRKYLGKIFGQVRASARAHYFWSNLPLLVPNVAGVKCINGKRGARSRREHLRASMIPYQVSQAAAIAVEREIALEAGA